MERLITRLWRVCPRRRSEFRREDGARISSPHRNRWTTVEQCENPAARRSFYLCLIILAAIVLSCSQGNTPVPSGKLVGKWQRVDKPAVSLNFQQDGGFSAEVAGTRVLAGRFQLLNGTDLVLVCDAASFKAGRVTNRVSLVRGQLNIGTPDGQTEKYKRVK